MGEFVDAAADLLLGSRCPGCRLPSWRLCAGCRTALAEGVPHALTRAVPGFPPTVAANAYAAEARRVVVAAKDEGAWSLAPVLEARLSLAVAGLLRGQACAGPVTLVPVPSSPAAVRRRGRDMVRHVARGAARRLGPGVRVAPVLTQARATADQGGLDRAARAVNVAGALRVRGRVTGPVVVVDDVVTTGATLAEATRALSAQGVEVVGGAAIAATRLRHDPASHATVHPADAVWRDRHGIRG